jgi:hypothetical protein
VGAERLTMRVKSVWTGHMCAGNIGSSSVYMRMGITAA